MDTDIDYRINIIEGRILEEKRKHEKSGLDWIHIASIKIAKDIEDLLNRNRKRS